MTHQFMFIADAGISISSNQLCTTLIAWSLLLFIFFLFLVVWLCWLVKWVGKLVDYLSRPFSLSKNGETDKRKTTLNRMGEKIG